MNKKFYLWLEFIIYIVHGFENLAYRKEVFELHPWPTTDKDYGGLNAVDGLYSDRSAAGGQCSISADNNCTKALWRVDLGAVFSISHIEIYFRTDNEPSPTVYTSKMAGFFLYVSNTTSIYDGYLCFHDIQTKVGTPLENQNISCTVYGRYVSFYNERRPEVVYPSHYSKFAKNDLCEVKVYGCKESGYFGEKCSLKCPANCQENRCNISTGYCLGCRRGYKGPSCKDVCDKMTYGLECAFTCSRCRNGTPCHHENGTCLQGCDEGVYGGMCQFECRLGYYGKNCLSNCSENCYVTRRCDKITGKCDIGCKPGWKSITCDQECDSGYFGPECGKTCGHCLNENHCHNVNGSCLHGCLEGFKGEFCNETCLPGYFGLNCVDKCSTYCKGSGSCDRVTGICDEGCKDGWRGGKKCGITQACQPGYYGHECLNKCSTNCKGNGSCNSTTGTCDGGCKAGWRGPKCETTCPPGYYGHECLNNCSTNCKGSGSCNSTTGTCDEACPPGYYGHECLNKCSTNCKGSGSCNSTTGTCDEGRTKTNNAIAAVPSIIIVGVLIWTLVI